jgi:hypothetical protein
MEDRARDLSISGRPFLELWLWLGLGGFSGRVKAQAWWDILSASGALLPHKPIIEGIYARAAPLLKVTSLLFSFYKKSFKCNAASPPSVTTSQLASLENTPKASQQNLSQLYLIRFYPVCNTLHVVNPRTHIRCNTSSINRYSDQDV